MCDGNLYALRQHENEMAKQDAYDEAVQEKTEEVMEELLSVNNRYEDAFVNDSKNNKIELSDFIADMEIDAGTFSEFLQECHYGQGSFFRNKIMAQLNKYCEEIAVDLVDNEEQPEPDCDY